MHSYAYEKPKTYEHIRLNNIMCLPCHKTIRKYVSNYNSGFGFNNKTFEVIFGKNAKCRAIFKAWKSYFRRDEIDREIASKKF